MYDSFSFDDLVNVVNEINFEIFVFTETWLIQEIPTKMENTKGYFYAL